MRMFRARRRPQSRGFSTVEILVTFAIVLMVGTIGLFSLGAFDGTRLRAETADVALFLQQARLRAAESGRNVVVRYDAKQGELQTAAATHYFGDALSLPDEDAVLRFRPSGLNNGFDLTIGLGRHRRSIEVDWLSGRIAVSS